MKQTARIISTYSADVMGVCSALFELGGMTIMHDASGCNSTYTTHDEPRWYDMDSMVYISGISEMEAIMGDDEKLIGDICDAAENLHPEFIAIAGTPIPTMTGFDFEAVAEVVEQRTGIPSFGFPTTGMNTYIHGASMALAGIAKRFVLPREEALAANAPAEAASSAEAASPAEAASSAEAASPETAGFRVNILGLTPLDFSINGTDQSIRKWLEGNGFEVISTWAMGCSLDDIRRSSLADVNLVVSAAGLGAADVLYDRFGIPYIVGLPIGEEPEKESPKVFLANMLRRYAEKKRAADRGEGSALETKSMTIRTDVSRTALSESAAAGESAAAKGTVAIIGEPVISLALSTAIEVATGMNTKVLCATEPMNVMLRPKDRVTPDEDDIIPELEDAAIIIADPLYRPICPAEAKFISLPSEAFSGRIFREDIPDLVADFGGWFRNATL